MEKFTLAELETIKRWAKVSIRENADKNKAERDIAIAILKKIKGKDGY